MFMYMCALILSYLLFSDNLFISDLNKVLKNHLSYDLRPLTQFTDLFNKYGKFLYFLS